MITSKWFRFIIAKICNILRYVIPRILRHMCNLHIKETEISQKRSKGIKNWKTRNTCTQQPLARCTGFSFPKYPRERFENANICISPTFQGTGGSHLKPSLPVVVMVTLNQFNSNLFVVSVNNNPLAKISHYNSIHIL